MKQSNAVWCSIMQYQVVQYHAIECNLGSYSTSVTQADSV